MKKVVPKLRQEVKLKVDIVTSDDIKIYYSGKFQDFTARYIINIFLSLFLSKVFTKLLKIMKMKILIRKLNNPIIDKSLKFKVPIAPN